MRDAGRELVPPADGATARFEFFEHVTELFRSEAAEKPQLLVLDDLQSADEDRFFCSTSSPLRCRRLPALILALTREDGGRLDDVRRHATRVLRLDRPLSAGDLGET